MQELLTNLVTGAGVALQWENIVYCFVGVFLGTLVGVLPGIGALAAISMLLPVTYYVDPIPAIVMLAGVYYGAEYGGSVASILLHLPGTTSNAVTILDGYPMAQQGRAGVALLTTAVTSFVGGMCGIVLMIAFAPLLAEFALSFQSPEYFALMVFGLLAAAGVAQGSPLKALAMVLLGLLLGSVGTDIHSGVSRYTLGYRDLYDGISLVALAMGLFGLSEVINSLVDSGERKIDYRFTFRSLLPTREDVRRCVAPTFRGAGVGSFIGALPGTGASIATFIAYALEKRVSRKPAQFGTGAIEGIASPESANNAAAQTAFIPTLSMGIPGSASMAVILGALMLHGIAPGPALMNDHPELFWGLVISFLIGNAILLVLNIPLIGMWIRILQVPYSILAPIIVALICIGVFSISNNPFDLYLLVIFATVGYLLRFFGYPVAPLLLAFILGPLLEENLRRSMLIARGDYTVMFQRPISGMLLYMAIGIVVLILTMTVRETMRRRRDARAGAPSAGQGT